MPVDLGLGQGTILGPLCFIIFINDLPNYIKNTDSNLFADDTTLLYYDNTIEKLILKNKNSLDIFTRWCTHNRLDINWDKTNLMFIHNKRNVIIPDFVEYNDNKIEVVNEFRLLGVTIDNKLSFIKHVRNIESMINKKMYSIKRLFHLPKSVKVQFFKTFITPYFDYCSSLLI